jgi:hypothetical protein
MVHEVWGTTNYVVIITFNTKHLFQSDNKITVYRHLSVHIFHGFRHKNDTARELITYPAKFGNGILMIYDPIWAFMDIGCDV